KDQSYMLARLDPRFLDRLWFPLGTQTKDETRAEAERAGLAAARKPESQEACFLAGDDYRNFLSRNGLRAHRGPIADETGRRPRPGGRGGSGRSRPGRRGGVAAARSAPLFAIRSDAVTNPVVAGPLESLATTTVTARGRLYVDVRHVDAKLRYRSQPIPATVAT